MRRQAYKMCIPAKVIKYVNAESFEDAMEKALDEGYTDNDEIILDDDVDWIEEFDDTDYFDVED